MPARHTRRRKLLVPIQAVVHPKTQPYVTRQKWAEMNPAHVVVNENTKSVVAKTHNKLPNFTSPIKGLRGRNRAPLGKALGI